MSDYTNFLSIIQNSEACGKRWSKVVERAISDAAERGVTLDENDVLSLRSARTAALGAPLDEDTFAAEMMALPSMSDVALKAKIAEGDEEARSAALQDLSKDDQDVHHTRWNDHAARKVARARDLGIDQAPVAKDAMSDTAKLDLIKQISSPAERLAMGRRLGLV